MIWKALGAAALLACTLIGPQVVPARAAQPGEVEVIAGGIGDSEQQALLAREKAFNLKLVFSLVQGNYVADVDLVITDAKGEKVIERWDDGPFVLARLPEGRYSVAATHAGRTVARNLTIVAGRQRTEHFRWPADPAVDLPVSRWIDKE